MGPRFIFTSGLRVAQRNARQKCRWTTRHRHDRKEGQLEGVLEGDSEREFRNRILNDSKMDRVWARRAVGVDALNSRLDEGSGCTTSIGTCKLDSRGATLGGRPSMGETWACGLVNNESVKQEV